MVSFRGPLLRAIADTGRQVYAFAIDYDAEKAAAVRGFGAEPVLYCLDRTGTHPARDLETVQELSRAFNRLRIDTVLTYFVKPVVLGSAAAVLAQVPHRFAKLPGLGALFTNAGTERSSVSSVTRWLGHSGIKLALKSNQRVFLYNREDEEELTRKRLVDPSKVHHLNGTGVDLTEYGFAPPVTSPVTFLMMARLLADKGVHEFAAAAQLVKNRWPDARFLLLGGIDTNPSAISEEEVRSWVEKGIIEWPGSVPDVRPWLEKASVFVLPSYREGVPRSTQEALALGRPVITTDAIGCRKTVEPGRNGFLVPVQDAESLAKRMMEFLRKPDLIARMGLASRRLAEERFDIHEINTEILKVMGLADGIPDRTRFS